ncbi:MAG: type II toxin-antitoxin system Phd/YefM family antitoxin [Deltaproteobacteria bacterium]|nr:type II toxin-antitoxin system Phd/YefM family antitoxin [Deltaproteobacteria bacterium]
MTRVNVHEAKTHLSRLLAQVEEGEEVIIARSGKAIARLVAFVEDGGERAFGRDAGLFEVPEDFDEPLPPEFEQLFSR